MSEKVLKFEKKAKGSKKSLPIVQEKHAYIAPSAMKRIMKCPGSVYLAALAPVVPPSIHAEEGTLAHACAEKALKYMIAERNGKLEIAMKLSGAKKHSEDMFGYVRDYVEFCLRVERKFAESYDILSLEVERKVRFSQYISGTADFLIIGKHRELKEFGAVLIDLKYGQGLEVEAEGNEQVITYLTCAKKEFPRLKKAWGYIYQPRIESDKPYSGWQVDEEALVSWGKQLEALEQEVLAMTFNEIPLRLYAGNMEHCRWCPAKLPGKHQCPEFKEATLLSNQKMLIGEEKVLPSASELSLEDLLKVKRVKKLVEKLLDDVDLILHARALKGEVIPGYKLVDGKSVRKWKEDTDLVVAGLQDLGIKDPWSKKLQGIGDISKQLGKKADSLIEHLVERSTPKQQLVPLDDKRDAVVVKGIQSMLSDLSTKE